MRHKRLAAFILALVLCSFILLAQAEGQTTYDDWTVTIQRNTAISNITVTGTLTVVNEGGGNITFKNCSIAHLVLQRAENADAPIFNLGEGCMVEDLTIMGSAFIQALPEAQLKKMTVADACDVQLEGNAGELMVTSGSVLTLNGQVENLNVSRSAQINLTGNARVANAVFENSQEGTPSVLKIDTYASVDALETRSGLVVNGTGSVDRVTAGENSSVDMDVTITRRDSVKTDADAKESATLNYARKELLPMVFDAIGSRKLKDTAQVTLTVRDIFGFSLDAGFAAVSSNPAAVSVTVSGNQLTLTRVGPGYSLISISADLTGYLPAHTAFMASEGKEVTVPNLPVDKSTVQLKLSLGNICNKTLAAGEELKVFGVSCDQEGARITAASSDTTVAKVSAVSGGSFTVTGVHAGIAVVTVMASKAEDTVKYAPAIQKFVVSVDEEAPQRTQLTVGAPSQAQLTKVYDGTTSANIPTGKLSGIKNGDDVYAVAIAFYADKNVGTGKTVYVSYHIYGKNADLYLAPQDAVYTNGAITLKEAAFQAASVSRPYEPGNLNVLLADVKPVGLVASDRVSLNDKNATVLMKDEWAGADKPVEIMGYRLIGDDAGNYRLVMPKKITVTITPAVQEAVAVTSAATHVYGTDYDVTAQGGTGTGRLKYSILPGGTGEADIDARSGRLTVAKAGTILLQVTREADDNYQQVSCEPFTLTVNKAEQKELNVTSSEDMTYGRPYTVTAAGGSGKGAVTYAVLPGGTGAAVVNSVTGELTVTKAGAILLKAIRAEDDNYLEKSSKPFTLTVAKAQQAAVAVTSGGDVDFDDMYAIAAEGGSGTGAFIYSAVPGGTGEAAVNSATRVLTITKAGTIKLKAVRAGDDNYLEKASNTFTLTVHRAEQAALVFTSSSEMTFEDSYIAVAAGGSGSGGFSYEIVSGGTGIASVGGDTGVLTVKRAGTILIKATKAGDVNWLQKISDPLEVTVHKAEQAALSIVSGPATVYGTTYDVTAEGGSGTGDITYAVAAGGTGEAAVNASTGRLTVTKAGTILLSATRAGDVNYLEKTCAAFILTVNKAEQGKLGVISDDTVTYGEPYTVSGKGGSGTGAISFSVMDGGTGIAAVDSTTGVLTVSKAGTIMLTVTKAEDDNYLVKTSEPFTLTVGKAQQASLSFTSGSTVAFDGSYTAAAAGGTGTGTVTFSIMAGGTGEATINAATGELTITRAGTIKLVAVKAEDDNYLEESSAAFSLSINKAAPSGSYPLTVTSASSTTFSSAYTVTASGGRGTGEITYSVTGGGTGEAAVEKTSGILTVTKSGTILLKATRAADDNYEQVESEVFTLTVNKGTQAQLNISSSASATYGAPYTTAVSGGSGTGKVSYGLFLDGTAEAGINSNTGVLTITKAGTLTLIATKAGDENYLPVTSETFALTIHKAAQAALNISSAASVNMGSGYTAAVSGGSGTGAVSFEITGGGTGSAGIDSATGVLSNIQAGTIFLKASKAGDDNYQPAESSVFTLTVNKLPQAVLSLSSAASVTFGDSYTASATGGSGTGNISFSIAEGGTGDGTIDGTTGALTITKAGAILLKATKAGDGTYLDADSAAFTLTVNKAAQAEVSITSASSMIIGNSYTVTATGGTGTGALTYAVAGGTGTATVNSTTGELNATKAGTILLTATRVADDNYNAKQSAAFTLNVLKGNQTLTLTSASPSGGAGTTVALTPSAPGVGAITYAITGGSSSGASVSGSGVVTLGTVGTVTVTATIAECSSYYTASDSVTVESTPVAPAVTAFSVGRANSFDGSYRDQISFSPTIYNPSGPSYPVTVTYSIAKTGSHGSIVYSDNTASTARVAVGTYSVTCTAANSIGSSTRSDSVDIPQTATSTGKAESGITSHDVILYFNGNGAIVTSYSWYANTAPGHNASGQDTWSIIGYTGTDRTGSSMALAGGNASAGASDSRSISESSGIRSIVFTYTVASGHDGSCLSSDVSYTVSTLIPYNDVN